MDMDREIIVKYLKLLLKSLGLYLVIEPELTEDELKAVIKVLEITKKRNYNYNYKTNNIKIGGE